MTQIATALSSKPELGTFFQITKEDLANMAVSELENRLHEFVDEKQTELQKVKKQITDIQGRFKEKLDTVYEGVKNSRAVQRYVETVESLAEGRKVLPSLAVGSQRLGSFSTKQELLNYLESEENNSIFTVTLRYSVPRNDKKDEFAADFAATFYLGASLTSPEVYETVKHTLGEILGELDSAMAEQAKIVNEITEARGQLADMDRIVREANSAVARVAMESTPEGQQLMAVLQQIPGYDRFNKLIGAPK